MSSYTDFWGRLSTLEGLVRLAEIRLEELERIRHSHRVEVRSAGIENGRASHRDKEAAGEVPELE